MKPTFCFCLLTLAGAGCLGLPTGTQGDLEKPPQAELVAPPVPLKPDEINEGNARNALKRLEQEITFDERAEPPPEAAPPPPAAKEPEKEDTLKKPEKPKRSGRPWGPTWG